MRMKTCMFFCVLHSHLGGCVGVWQTPLERFHLIHLAWIFWHRSDTNCSWRVLSRCSCHSPSHLSGISRMKHSFRHVHPVTTHLWAIVDRNRLPSFINIVYPSSLFFMFQPGTTTVAVRHFLLLTDLFLRALTPACLLLPPRLLITWSHGHMGVRCRWETQH